MIDEAAEWHRIAEERRRQLERLRLDARFQVAAGLLSAARRLIGPPARAVGRSRALGLRLMRSVVAAPSRAGAAARERRLRDQVRGLRLPEPLPQVSETVTAVIVTAAQPERLSALLDSLDRIGVRALVVDNAGVPEIARVVDVHPMAQRIDLRVPASFSAANEIAMRHVTTEWVVLMNDDVRPVDDSWAARMLAAADDDTVAVGALLVHGRRGWAGGAAVDLRVQHAGIGFVLDGATPVPIHLGRGEPPAPRCEAPRVVAATAACLLVRTEAYLGVGGLDLGFDYGMEDVDLCLRLAERGQVRVALDAVLLHEEGATRLDPRSGPSPELRASRQHRNRARLIARHGVRLRRELVGGGIDPVRPNRVTVVGPVPPGIQDRGFEIRRVRGGWAHRRHHLLADATAVIITDPGGAGSASANSPAPIVAWGEEAIAGLLDGRWRGTAPDLIVGPDVVAPDALRRRWPTVVASTHATHIADRVSTALAEVMSLPRWSIRVGAPSGRRGARWGDLMVAEAIRVELRGRGIVARTTAIDRWGYGFDATADVAVHLKGRGVAPAIDGQCNVLWVMSHPSEIAPGELDAADLILAGSSFLAERLRALSSTPVHVLPQAADARRLLQAPKDGGRASRVLFIGNTRSEPRPVVMGAIDDGLPLTLIGSGWERFIDPGLVTKRSVTADELGGWYRSAEVVLNDHWDDMSRWGLVSNRVFDALACGACVVSDEIPGMDELLDGAVVTFRDRADVGPTVRALLDDRDARAERAERGRRLVLESHTWEHRAAELVRLVAELTCL